LNNAKNGVEKAQELSTFLPVSVGGTSSGMNRGSRLEGGGQIGGSGNTDGAEKCEIPVFSGIGQPSTSKTAATFRDRIFDF
jgi:hypothetical protein